MLTGANGDETVIGYDVAARRLYIDRTKSGTAAAQMTGFYGVHSAPLTLRDGTLNLRILVDNSIVEVFAEDGERVLDGSRLPGDGQQRPEGLRGRRDGDARRDHGPPDAIDMAIGSAIAREIAIRGSKRHRLRGWPGSAEA